MKALLLILQAGQVVGSIGTVVPIALQAAIAIRKIFAASGTDFSAELVMIQEAATHSAENTLKIIAEWEAANQ